MFDFFSIFFSGLTIYILSLCCFYKLIVRFSGFKKLIPLIVLLIFMFFPVGQLSVFQYLRSFFGDLSVASLGFFGVLAVNQLFSRSLVPQNEASVFGVTIIIMAAFLYPMSLGLSYIDPYAWGFGHLYFEALLGLGTLFWVWKGYFFLVAWWLLSYIFYLLKGFESNNLWDYLIDPVVCLAVSYCKNKKGQIDAEEYVGH
jgi:hypothetical protein